MSFTNEDLTLLNAAALELAEITLSNEDLEQSGIEPSAKFYSNQHGETFNHLAEIRFGKMIRIGGVAVELVVQVRKEKNRFEFSCGEIIFNGKRIEAHRYSQSWKTYHKKITTSIDRSPVAITKNINDRLLSDLRFLVMESVAAYLNDAERTKNITNVAKQLADAFGDNYAHQSIEEFQRFNGNHRRPIIYSRSSIDGIYGKMEVSSPDSIDVKMTVNAEMALKIAKLISNNK